MAPRKMVRSFGPSATTAPGGWNTRSPQMASISWCAAIQRSSGSRSARTRCARPLPVDKVPAVFPAVSPLSNALFGGYPALRVYRYR